MTYPRTQKEIRRAIRDLHTIRFSLDSLREQRRYCPPEEAAEITNRITNTAAYLGVIDDAIAHIPVLDREVLQICMDTEGRWQAVLAQKLMVSEPTACRRLRSALRSMQIALTGEAQDD